MRLFPNWGKRRASMPAPRRPRAPGLWSILNLSKAARARPLLSLRSYGQTANWFFELFFKKLNKFPFWQLERASWSAPVAPWAAAGGRGSLVMGGGGRQLAGGGGSPQRLAMTRNKNPRSPLCLDVQALQRPYWLKLRTFFFNFCTPQKQIRVSGFDLHVCF